MGEKLDSDGLVKKPFSNFGVTEDKRKPISIKLNDENEEMIEIGGYCFNMHSKGGILKKLAKIGLKVILKDFGAEEMHYLTRGDRTRLVLEKPKYKHFSEKGI